MLLTNKKDIEPKVKLIAIAKDESAYLPEWIHHYLYLGVDEIDIFINRTTDNSDKILEQICSIYDNVHWDYSDWVDMCPSLVRKNIQFVTYARSFYKAKKEDRFTHVFFLDIDEFLILDNLKSNIKNFLKNYPADDAIYFEWINDVPESSLPFENLRQSFTGNLSPLGKTLLPINSNISELRHHIPVFKGKKNIKLVDKKDFLGRDDIPQALIKNLNNVKSSYIYHRANRSDSEYISLLYRGRPGDDIPYKSNRRGFPTKNDNTLELNLDKKEFNSYRKSFETFLEKTGVEELLIDSRSFIKQRYNESLLNLPKYLKVDYELLVRLFSGTKDLHVINSFREHRANIIRKNPRNIKMLLKLSSDAEKINKIEAIDILKYAEKIRPDGPLIKQRLNKLVKDLEDSSDNA